LVSQPGSLFRLITVVSLVAGTMFLIWLGEQIFARGVTDGIWLLLVADYVAGLPAGVYGLIESTYNGIPTQIIPICAAVLVALVGFIVFVERAERRLPEPGTENEWAKRPGQTSAFLALRIDNTGILAPTIASWLLLPIVTVNTFRAVQDGGWAEDFFKALERGRPLYLLVYALLILLFVFFFTAIVVNKKQRSSYPTREAAKLDAALAHLTLLGALYLAILCIVPELMINFFAISFYLGGTSLLLTALVGLDTLARVR